MFTCENAVFLLRLLPANFQRGVQDVSEAEVSNSARGCESNKQNPHQEIKQTAWRVIYWKHTRPDWGHSLSSWVRILWGRLRGPSPGVVKHKTDV